MQGETHEVIIPSQLNSFIVSIKRSNDSSDGRRKSFLKCKPNKHGLLNSFIAFNAVFISATEASTSK